MFTFLQLPVSSADRLDTLLAERPTEPAAIVTSHDYGEVNPGDVMLRVSAGSTPLTKMVLLNADQHATVLAEIEAYNADPERGWEALVEELARRVAPIRTALLAQRADNIRDVSAMVERAREYRHLRFVPNKEPLPEPPTQVRVTRNAGGNVTVIVHGDRRVLFDLLYTGADSPELQEEVQRLTADLPGEYRVLELDELRARYAQGAAEIAAQATALSDLADRIREQELT